MEGELEIILESIAKENRKMQALLQATWRGETHSTRAHKDTCLNGITQGDLLKG